MNIFENTLADMEAPKCECGANAWRDVLETREGIADANGEQFRLLCDRCGEFTVVTVAEGKLVAAGGE